MQLSINSSLATQTNKQKLAGVDYTVRRIGAAHLDTVAAVVSVVHAHPGLVVAEVVAALGVPGCPVQQSAPVHHSLAELAGNRTQ